ncbi:Tumor necrosis factor receptor superfamily member 8 like, partial [Quillaja saponaria]
KTLPQLSLKLERLHFMMGGTPPLSNNPKNAECPTAPPEDPPSKPSVLPSRNNKRKRKDVDLHRSSFLKICALIQELRLQVIEVLRTPDFRNCKAANEIRNKIKLLVVQYKGMTVEKEKAEKFASEFQPFSGGSVHENEYFLRCQGGKKREVGVIHGRSFLEKSTNDLSGKQPQVLQARCFPDTLAKDSRSMPLRAEMRFSDAQNLGSYVVGGSVFGWNFITYVSSKPVYYGVTKESFRSSFKKP